jgi:hypothetical protein
VSNNKGETMKLTEEITKPFIEEINLLCAQYGVMITAHCMWIGYGEDGKAAHMISNAPSHKASAAQAQECLEWYRDGKFREHTRQ